MNVGLQLASASVDGIVKVWNVAKHTCLNSFEMHEDRIWALDFAESYETTTTSDEEIETSRPNLMMITGGSDSKIKVWQDNTKEEVLRLKNEKLDQMHDE